MRPAKRAEDDVVFVTEDDAEAPAPLTAKDASEPLKNVRVLPPFQVVYDTVPYRGGDMPEVPVSLADEWLRNSWVEPLA